MMWVLPAALSMSTQNSAKQLGMSVSLIELSIGRISSHGSENGTVTASGRKALRIVAAICFSMLPMIGTSRR